MAKNEVATSQRAGRAIKDHPKELDVEIKTSVDFKAMMSAMMRGVLSGDITPGQANAACNAGGKLLKVVEMEMRYKQNHGIKLIP